jgi:hypothetical protein
MELVALEGNLPAEKTWWKRGSFPDLTLSTTSRTPVFVVMSATMKLMRSREPTYFVFLSSFSAEAWFRTTASTWRPERNAAYTAETPMWPVEPITRTVSISQ